MAVNLGETSATTKPRIPAPVTLPPRELVYEIEQFLFREARLLEEERYDEWLGTMTEDVLYWMPGVQARYRKDKAPRFSHTRMALFDDDLFNLRRRVTRAVQETAWAEDPPTRTCYMVSNIEVEPIERTDEFKVNSVILNVRGRNETEEDWLLARRKDLLRRIGDGSFRLAKREIYITQSVLLAKNLNVFL
ncbi:3-phenylpropionate/cinnamic acid dioxygenase subunit beta [Microbacteriaceae bacterium K1510]|nr:3-phenylpropionate/cinnamic acid dioxygenase subunit beta [Microbacteriaceae bacterium K1510]